MSLEYVHVDRTEPIVLFTGNYFLEDHDLGTELGEAGVMFSDNGDDGAVVYGTRDTLVAHLRAAADSIESGA